MYISMTSFRVTLWLSEYIKYLSIVYKHATEVSRSRIVRTRLDRISIWLSGIFFVHYCYTPVRSLVLILIRMLVKLDVVSRTFSL
jgi:hypothetical protein